MEIKDVVNRLKDTRGFINEQVEEQGLSMQSEAEYMLEGIEEAIKLIQDLQAK